MKFGVFCLTLTQMTHERGGLPMLNTQTAKKVLAKVPTILECVSNHFNIVMPPDSI
jgi:hypothetical protein